VIQCLRCRTELDPVNIPYGTHPGCDMNLLPVDDEDPFATLIKNKIIEMVRWADQQNPRAQQQAIGPSELGTVCDRRIGYRVAGVPARNVDFDPWAAVVGTAIHSWMDSAVRAWMVAHGSSSWSTETGLSVAEFVEGRADLYSHDHRAVIDYKTVGPDIMRRIRKDGPPPGYQIQTHLYGLGFERKGLQVDKVCLVFLPRAGWIKDMYTWCGDYDRDIALGSLARLQGIAQQILNLNILTNGNEYRWEQIEAAPSNDCGWCPWYDPGRDLERGADATGCPGR
jgi:hypothetical protein